MEKLLKHKKRKVAPKREPKEEAKEFVLVGIQSNEEFLAANPTSEFKIDTKGKLKWRQSA